MLGFLIVVGTIFSSGAGGRSGASPALPSRTRDRAPSDLTASAASNGAVLLSWRPSSSPVGYRLYRAIGRHGSYLFIGSVDSPIMDSFIDTVGLRAGMTYSYKVTSYDRTGESVPVGPVEVLVLSVASTPVVKMPPPPPPFSPPSLPPSFSISHAPQSAIQLPLPAPAIGFGR